MHVLKPLLLILLCWIASGMAWAQITPTTPAQGGSTVTYSVNNGIVYGRPNWIVVNGSVQSTSASGTTYSATVLWANTCTGLTGQLNFRNATTLVTYREIEITAPTATTISTSRCGEGPVVLTATPSPANGTIRWYDAASGGNLVGTANTYSPTLNVTTTYYASCYVAAANCEGSRVAATANINTFPSDPFLGPRGTSAISCGTNTFNLLARFFEANTTFVWYTTATGGSPFATGAPVSQTVSATTTYYGARRHDLTGCESNRVPLTLTVESAPANFVVGGTGSHCRTGTVTLAGSQGGYAYQLQLNGADLGAPTAGTNAALTWNGLTDNGNYSVVAKSPLGACTQTMEGTANLTVYPVSVGGTTTGGINACAPAAGAVILSGHLGNVVSWEQNTGSGWTTVAETNATLNYSNLMATTQYRAAVQNGTCAVAYSTTTTITIESMPIAYAVGGTGTYCSAGTVNLAYSQSGYNYQLQLNGGNLGSPLGGSNAPLAWGSLTNGGTYTVVATSPLGTCTQLMGGTADITMSPAPIGGTAAGGTDVCTPATGAVTLSGHVGNIVRWEQNTGSDWTSLAQTSATLTYTNLTTTTHYRAVVQNGVCAEVYSSTATVTAHAPPSVAATANTILYGSASPQLSTGAAASYQWVRNGTDIAGANGQSYTVTSYGVYAVRTESTPGLYCTSANFIMGGIATTQSQPVNMTSTAVILKEGITDPSQLFNLQPHEVRQVLQYQDGLGRTYQTVAVAQAAGTGRGDLVSGTAWGRNGLVDSTFLPYATAVPDGRMRPNALRANNSYIQSEQYQFYQGTAKVAKSQHPFAKTMYRNAPDVRVTEQGAPGADWQPGANHTQRSTLTLNTASYPVKFWKPDGTTSGNYPTRSVSVAITTDENGNQVRTYTDSRGLTVLKQVQEGTSNWLQTYYVYDELGRLKYQVPPRAVAVLGAGTDVKTTNLAELIFTYSYDSLSRLKEKKVPGAATEALVYDQLNRVVFTQDGNLKAQGRWMFVKYDQRNRPVYSGLYTTTNTRHQLQAQLNGLTYSTTKWYEVEAAGASTYHGYSNQTWPTANLTILTVSYYDHYDFDRNGTADYAYDNAHLAGTPAQASTDTWGKATGSKRALLSNTGAVTTNFLVNVVFYDDYGRTLQTRENNPLNLTVQDKATVRYDNTRRVDRTRASHTAANATTHLEQRNTYDHAGRVLKTFHKINSLAEVQVAEYEYNALGQLVDKKLHVVGGLPLQSVDYRYHIRGWLQSINNGKLAGDNGVTNDDTNDYFGMEMLYNTTESGLGNTPYYNGNISATKWKALGTAGTIDQRSYKYTYDMANRLKTATFQAHSGTGTNWTKEAGTLNETMTYDANGNMATLTRSQNNRSLSGITVTSAPQTIDQLTYSYTANTNRLHRVDDAVATAIGAGDFKNGSSASNEYTYTADGSMNKDLNKGISSITYNVLGKPQVVTYSGTPAKTVTYAYDATGTKVKAVTVANNVTTTTDYVGGFVYTNNTLSFFSSPEGRIVKNGANFEYQYAIADHQGNTRVIFSGNKPVPSVLTATFEGNATDNSNQFTVNASNVVTYSAANNTAGGSKVVRMNQTYSTGPSKSLKVYAGDKVNMEVWAYYEAASGYGTTNQTVAAVIASVAGAFGGVSGGSGESGSIFSGVNSALTGFGAGSNRGDGAPSAHLNYILFDQQYKVLNAGWQVVPATANWAKQKVAMPTVTVKEAGYIFVYLTYSNQSNNWVYFDDFKITHTKTNVVQYNEYYPYGLQTANSWTRENSTQNNFLANGGTELNTTTSVYDLHYRNYDPALGRMNQVDPAADSYGSLTPYNYAFNAPTVMNDPLGDDPPRCAVCDGFGEKASGIRTYRMSPGQMRTGYDDITYSQWRAYQSINSLRDSQQADENKNWLLGLFAANGDKFSLVSFLREHENVLYSLMVNLSGENVIGISASRSDASGHQLSPVVWLGDGQQSQEFNFALASFYPKEFSNGNALLNLGSFLVGLGERGASWALKYPNGPRDLARGLQNLTGIRIGTTKFAENLRNVGTKISKLGKSLGYIGLVASAVDFTLNYETKNDYDKASFLIGTGVFLLSLNPATAVVGLIYGGAQLASYYFNEGKSAEQTIGEFVQKLKK